MSTTPDPRTRPGRRPHGRFLVTALALALCAATAFGQDVTEPALKAAFIYNFAKFTEWPADALPAAATFVACVVGDGAVNAALERSTKGRLLAGRPITVARVAADGPLRTCHLLYISGVSGAQLTQILAVVHGLPILTISDLDGFADIGGIVHVFDENGKMRFDLNLDLARRSRLQLSSKLLLLASVVRDAAGGVNR